MKEYPLLFLGEAEQERAEQLAEQVVDVAVFLDRIGLRDAPAPLAAPVTVAYHDACHLGHAQGITAQPRSLLHAIPELELVELRDPGVCCGSAGVYNLLQPDAASALGARKADSVAASGAPLLISANPGCTLQISAALASQGVTIRTAHIAEVLDASINGVPLA